MPKILQTHLLRAFVANLKIDAIYTLYPESFCDKNLAIREVFALPLGKTSRKKSCSSFGFCHQDGHRAGNPH